MNKQTSVAVFCSDYIVVAQHLTEIISSLSLQFCDVFVFTNCLSRISYRHVFAHNVHFVDIPFLRKPSFASDLNCLFQLFWHLRGSSFSLWLSFTPKLSLLLSLLWPLRFCQFPRPRRIHYFTGLLWESRKNIFCRNVYRMIDGFTLLTSDFVLADSHAQKIALKQLPFSSHVYCLGHGSLKGVNLLASSSPTLSSLPGTPRPFTLIFLGRLTPEKGLHDILSVFYRLSAKYSNIHLLLVGPIEHKSLEFLYSSTDECISYYPFTDDPFSFFSRSDLHILPSRREGFGSTVLESAACGIPTIGTSIPGLNESIAHGFSGLLVAPYDLDALHDCIEGLYLNPGYLLYLGRNARSRVESFFDQSDVIDRLCSFLSDCLP